MVGSGELGEEEWLANVVQSIYRNSRSRVRVYETFNDDFLVRVGPFVVACTSNPATSEVAFQNGVGSILVWGKSFNRSLHFVTSNCNSTQGKASD